MTLDCILRRIVALRRLQAELRGYRIGDPERDERIPRSPRRYFTLRHRRGG